MVRLRRDVTVERPDVLLKWYSENVSRGPDYYRHHDVIVGDPDRVEFGDLSWAVLLEGRPSSAAAQGLLTASCEDDERLQIDSVPTADLHLLSDDDRDCVAAALVALTGFPGIRASVASKVLHPKRRRAIPVLDNRAIFGTLANESWRPGEPQTTQSTRSTDRIRTALEVVYKVVADEGSQREWESLEDTWKPRSRIELFDMCWWAFIRGGDDLAARSGVVVA